MGSPIFKIIDASFQDLLALELESHQFTDGEKLYLKALIHYIKGDLETLENLLKTHVHFQGQTDINGVLYELAEMRLNIARFKTFNLTDFASFLKLAEDLNPILRAEAHLLAAFLYGNANDFQNECEQFQLAAFYFQKTQAMHRYIRAKMNALAAKTSIEPEKQFLAEHLNLSREAKKIKDHMTVGNCYLNISREYQKMNARRVALKYIQKSLIVLHNETGSLNYYMSLVHRAHLFLELNRYSEALTDLEEASAAPFEEIKSAVALLKSNFKAEVDPSKMTDSWRERMSEIKPVEELAELEQSLVDYISVKARDKFEIIEFLYGTRLPYQNAENRFKNVLSRVRKKIPNGIFLIDGKYLYQDPAEIMEKNIS